MYLSANGGEPRRTIDQWMPVQPIQIEQKYDELDLSLPVLSMMNPVTTNRLRSAQTLNRGAA